MSTYKEILKEYWGYADFRPLQEEIIQSVADGNDTLGLMPTGGGKSITYQVYSLANEGICLVITPLIALMKDQVENLRKRGIKALSIYSGMTREEIKVAFNNAQWGNYKFLYISPERIATEQFQNRLQQMKVNLIAVDEAHCISQWGYDFRPSYRKIADLRTQLPDVPMMALTATATQKVVVDIQKQLNFKNAKVLQKSFHRENLIYKVRYEEDKEGYLVRTLQKAKGSGIVYTRSRKKTKEIAALLQRNGISADYYHAGLAAETRSLRQDDWLNGTTRVIVATNAFGMGIDKPNVRFVIHVDAPDSIEAYFQEAGRAGRDELRAMAVFLYNNTDSVKLKKGIGDKFPKAEQIIRIYEALGNYLKIAVGFGRGMVYDFNMAHFAKTYRFSLSNTFNALKILQRDEYLELTDELDRRSLVHFRVERDELYRFQVANSKFDSFIKLLLRSYTGMFSEYRPINEELLSKRAKISKEAIFKYLNWLDGEGIIHYIPAKKTPLIVLLKERLIASRVKLSSDNYADRKKQYEKQVKAVIEYASNDSECRSKQLVAYFGEKDGKQCGKCDVCESLNKLEISNLEFDRIEGDIKAILEKEACMKHELFFQLKGNEDHIQIVINWLFDHQKLVERVDQKLEWKKE